MAQENKTEAPKTVTKQEFESSIKDIKVLYKNVESRVTEVENFRNSASIEGKISGLYNEIENLNNLVSQLKASDEKAGLKQAAELAAAVSVLQKEIDALKSDIEKLRAKK